MTTTYPFLGIGMSASISEAADIARARLEGATWYPVDLLNVGLHTQSVVPDGFRALMEKAGISIVAHLEEVNLVGQPEGDRLTALEELAERLGCSWVEQDLGVWTWNGARLGPHMIPPSMDRESLEESCRVVEKASKIFRRPMLVENPPFYAVHGGELGILEYLHELSQRTGCGLVLDIGHLVGFCMLTGRDPHEYLGGWACEEAVVEIHVAGYDLQETSRGVHWVDTHHRELSPKALDLLGLALEKLTSVKAITLEAELAPPDVIERGLASMRGLAGVEEARDAV